MYMLIHLNVTSCLTLYKRPYCSLEIRSYSERCKTMIKIFLVFLCGIILGYWLIDDFNPDALKGKRVFVTGASDGIGEQIAYQYAKYGANVFIAARRENKLKEVIEKCRQLGSNDQTYDYIVADMINLNSTENVIETAVRTLGGLDIIMLNHVFYLPADLWDGSKQNLSSMTKVMQINFESYVHLTSYALPHLEKSNGRITVINSLAGKIASPTLAPYSSAKFALVGFFNAIRQELLLRNSGVSVTQCFLGFIATRNVLEMVSSFSENSEKKFFPMASPLDAASAVVTGSAKGQRHVIYPGYNAILIKIRDWIPETIYYFYRYIYSILKSSK